MGTDRKELLASYKNRIRIGGVYVIRNTLKNKALIESTTDIESSRNLYEFTKKTGSCINMKLQRDYAEQNGEGFEFEVLETLTMKEQSSDAQFAKELAILADLWKEKLGSTDSY